MRSVLFGNEGNQNRQSNYELLRLIAMFFIVLYHFLRWFVRDNPSFSVMKSFWLPLHVGVICFILISGYFMIKPSSKGFIKLVLMVFVYSLPSIIVGIKDAGNWHDLLHSFMFVSRTNYWFVRTYLGLYLFSPLINAFLNHSSIKAKWYMLIVSGIISIYLGNISGYNLYSDGKNLVNFLFLYQLGHMLSYYSKKWKEVKIWKVVSAYVLLNVLLVVGYYCSFETSFGDILWRFSFPYNSLLLIVNAVLLFMLVGRMSFKSMLVNRLSAGVFAIYLIHCCIPMVMDFQTEIVSGIFSFSSNYLMFVGLLVILALVVMLLCLIINWLLSPIWLLTNSLGCWANKKLGF